MIRILLFILSFTLLLGACSTQQEKDVASQLVEIEIGDSICFNHSVLVLDSTTYSAAVNSKFLQRFAFSEERQLNGYKGFYLFGKTNYLELFHPKSFDGYEEDEGAIWICLASLLPHHLETLDTNKFDFFDYEFGDPFNSLSLVVNDSIDPTMTVWEMRKKHYEGWAKKEYHDSVRFLPVDYNSPTDADSSDSYLMNDLVGIGLSLNSKDSLKVIHYLQEIGFDSHEQVNGHLRVSNNDQFFEFHSSPTSPWPTINRYYIHLNEWVEPISEIIGDSRIECDGYQAIWYFENMQFSKSE